MVVQCGKGSMDRGSVRKNGLIHEKMPQKDDWQGYMSYDELLTAITEVGMILNSRHFHGGYWGAPHTLTFAHWSESTQPAWYFTLSGQNWWPGDLTQLFEQTNEVYLSETLDHFWRMEYLLDLHECHCYGNRNSDTTQTLLIGDVVLVHCEDRPRGFWRLARVEDIMREVP